MRCGVVGWAARARGTQDFGREALDELMAALEPGDPVVVFAGYDDASMDRFVAENPGLLRRVSRVFEFAPYSTVRARFPASRFLSRERRFGRGGDFSRGSGGGGDAL